MFLGPQKTPAQSTSSSGSSEKNIKNIAYAVILIFVLSAIAFVVIFTRQRYLENQNKQLAQLEKPPVLPPNLGDNNNNKNSGDGSDVKGESLFFGNFYIKPTIDFEVKLNDYKLPLNSKADVINYYDISRKINLDKALDSLNKNGFAKLENQYIRESNDFYGFYSTLQKNNIPLLITSDFLFYYFQNSLKDIYKKIEKNIFYDDIWASSQSLYDIAEKRYKTSLAKKGDSNEALIEAERQEVAYFAVILHLLSPQKNQIGITKDGSLFSATDAQLYSFTLPEYLKDDVLREVEMMRKGYETAKSPVLHYGVDYKIYKVPDNYRRDAKLNNFYLASKWMNSVFPIYQISENCPQCLLDKEDWMISMMSASLISHDLHGNQDAKNKWAKIYKIISYFSGLRNDLTYLSYDEAAKQLFGNDYDVQKLFSSENSEREKNIYKLQEKLGSRKFSELEAGLHRESAGNKPYIGFRLLQEPYWPNDYIFSQLVYPNVKEYLGKSIDNKVNYTFCEQDRTRIIYRCKGFALDIANLIFPIPQSNKIFIENTNFNNYSSMSKKLKEMLGNFNENTWHSNAYWTTLNMAEKFLASDNNEMPSFTRNLSWKNKEIDTVLGAWLNMQLPGDKVISGAKELGSTLNAGAKCNNYNYIEPNISLVQELIANTKMLSDIMDALKITGNDNSIKEDLKILHSSFQESEKIVKKELTGEALTDEDSCYIMNLADRYSMDKEGIKDQRINFFFEDRLIFVKESVKGVSMMVAVYKKGNDNVIAVGPAFNFIELGK